MSTSDLFLRAAAAAAALACALAAVPAAAQFNPLSIVGKVVTTSMDAQIGRAHV